MDPVLSTDTAQPRTLNILVVVNIVQAPRKCSCFSCALLPRKGAASEWLLLLERRTALEWRQDWNSGSPQVRENVLSNLSNPSSQVR